MKNTMKQTVLTLALAITLPLCAAESLTDRRNAYPFLDASTWTKAPPANMNITNLTGDPLGTVTHFASPDKLTDEVRTLLDRMADDTWTITNSIEYAVINTCDDVMTAFSLLTTNCAVVTVTNQTPQKVDGRFWLEWVVETNTYTPRRTMEGFAWPSLTDVYLTNSLSYGSMTVTNLYVLWPPLPEPTEGTETYYVSSNLWFHVTWRGRTNSDCLESIPVRTEVRRWKIEEQKVYVP